MKKIPLKPSSKIILIYLVNLVDPEAVWGENLFVIKMLTNYLFHDISSGFHGENHHIFNYFYLKVAKSKFFDAIEFNAISNY